MQLHAFRAASPRMEQFVFDFYATREHDQFAYRRRLLHVNSVINRDPWLQMRNIDERGAQILAQPLQLSRALPRCARRPTLQTQEDNENRCCNDQCQKRQRDRPREAMRDSGFRHRTFGVDRFCSDAIEQEQDHEQEESSKRLSPKKLPPPTPDRHEGRLFPPEQS